MYFLYCMVDPDKPNKCKIGITKNKEQRLKAYRTASPQCFFSETYDIDNKSHEKKILNILKDICQVDREYVHMCPDMVNRVIQSYLSEL